MIQTHDLGLLYAYGAELDAWAAAVSRHLGEQLPDYRTVLEQNRKDELVHAQILSGLASGFVTPTGYSRTIGQAAMGPDVRLNSALLNFVERRSEIQFRLAWRLTRNADLLQIAHDEARHVKLGREIIRSVGVSRELLVGVARWLDGVDARTGTTDVEGLRSLNQRVLDETLDAL